MGRGVGCSGGFGNNEKRGQGLGVGENQLHPYIEIKIGEVIKDRDRYREGESREGGRGDSVTHHIRNF